MITPDQLAAIFATPVDYQADHVVSGDDNYYIIFTSGTTGMPKGSKLVMITWSVTLTGC